MDSAAHPLHQMPLPPSIGAPPDAGHSQIDWEDWLRWDPAAEPTSPDCTFHSASSKNDSPIQDPSFPVAYGKIDDEPLVSPLIAGDDSAFAFGNRGDFDNDFTLFSAGHANAALAWSQAGGANEAQPNLLKLDTNAAAWTLPSNAAPDSSVSLSALSSEQGSQLPCGASLTAHSPNPHHSPNTSPPSSNSKTVSSQSADPPAKKRGGWKRKADTQLVSNPDHVERGGNGDSQEGEGLEPPMKKTSHNVIEKRYRNNLNDKIIELRQSVPSLRAMGLASRGDSTEDLDGLTPAHKLNKTTIMAKATEYIKHLEKRNKAMAEEMAGLKARLAQVEVAIGKSKDRQVSLTSTSVDDAHGSGEAAVAHSDSPGFLNIPQDQTRFGQPVVQQKYIQQQEPPAYSQPPNPPVDAQNQPHNVNRRGNSLVNKMILGTMSGIMLLEGFTEQQSGDDASARQLASIPAGLFKRGFGGSTSLSPVGFSSRAIMPLLKLVLVASAVVYLLAPLLSYSPRKKRKISAPIQLPKAPSLASPVEVRRQAWLTAIQTVWAPKHFLLEVVLVGSKMFQLSMRRFVGTEAFMALTGTNKEDEAARIKAWDIAIDAQLAGGDAHVSYYRLLLTLMESGTLPDSPARLMQKAVHFRVFFWEVANAGYGNFLGFKAFTEKVGRIYWNSARRIQKELVHAQSQGRTNEEDCVDVLPDYLARLVELDCDEVLSGEMIQRAWNLAWNKPSAYGLRPNAARDSVVEDHAIRSPLDAVAAWYTNVTIDETLEDALSEKASTSNTEYHLGLALSVAPPASSTHVRALAAKAVLSSTNREVNIVVALEALPVILPTGGMNLVNHAPASPDVVTALTLAKLISLSSSPATGLAGEGAAYGALDGLKLAPGQFTLLTAVAAYRLLRMLVSCNVVSMEKDRLRRCLCRQYEYGLEELAGSLRVWAGTSSGLDHSGRTKVIQMCVQTMKQLGGWMG